MVLSLDFLRRIFGKRPDDQPVPQGAPPPLISRPVESIETGFVRRHFYNEAGFQTYGSFFNAWSGWITAAHVLDEAKGLLPPFADGIIDKWPVGLDAALIGCTLPDDKPSAPASGQRIKCIGYPAGSAHPAERHAQVYMERPGQPDTWIAHILQPDEPVVTGMSGGAVIDTQSGLPIGIIITRNSPADLNNDRDPDESLDFVSLAGIWQALQTGPSVA
ncbi:MAG: serine protease [Acidimicrobiales bacterium]|nr:trypsin-like peptidase domain-containing protein [Hyphomonadaceae bacterium]RZV40814.1 MAG: serine protease [Acidimicrobiales bacterium]